MVMRMPLPMVAKEPIEAAFEWLSGVAWFAKTPFTKASANVAEIAEELA